MLETEAMEQAFPPQALEDEVTLVDPPNEQPQLLLCGENTSTADVHATLEESMLEDLSGLRLSLNNSTKMKENSSEDELSPVEIPEIGWMEFVNLDGEISKQDQEEREITERHVEERPDAARNWNTTEGSSPASLQQRAAEERDVINQKRREARKRKREAQEAAQVSE